MSETKRLVCDGCGQMADEEHIARRLRRLEETTKYRPIHLQTLLLGLAAPEAEEEFLYAESGGFAGEAAEALRRAEIAWEGKEREAVLGEFQKKGWMLAHVLECPVKDGAGKLADGQMGLVAARVRRSLKPKRVVVFGEGAKGVVEGLKGRGIEAEGLS